MYTVTLVHTTYIGQTGNNMVNIDVVRIRVWFHYHLIYTQQLFTDHEIQLSCKYYVQSLLDIIKMNPTILHMMLEWMSVRHKVTLCLLVLKVGNTMFSNKNVNTFGSVKLYISYHTVVYYDQNSQYWQPRSMPHKHHE